MKSFTRLILIYGPILLALSACGGNDKSDENADNAIDITDFVTRQFAATSDKTDPVDVNAIIFRFEEQDNSNAFENLLN